ncbi:MAG: xanthine dehydrogenase family protein molybdopterin-binding subunit [Bacillota bacterium]
MSTNSKKKRGKGFACMFYPGGPTWASSPSAAYLKVEQDGSVRLLTGAVDLGQGSSVALAQIAAQELGVRFERVKLVEGDTGVFPYDAGTVGSRVTLYAGWAVKNAACQAREQILRGASLKLGIEPKFLLIDQEAVYVQGNSGPSMSYEAAVDACYKMGILPVGLGWYSAINYKSKDSPVTGVSCPTFIYGAQCAEVEVDCETGEVTVLKLYVVHDCGKAINPLLIEGQLHGAAAMGLGYAILEEMVHSVEGKVLNPSFRDYIIPTAADVPDVECSVVEVEDPNGPFGAKGIAEPALLPTAPAIVNAIYDAVGVLITELPVTPEKILRELKKKESEK